MSIRTMTFAALSLVALTHGALAQPQHNTDTGVLGLPPKAYNPLMTSAALKVQQNPLMSSAAIRVPCAVCNYRPPMLVVRTGR